MIAHRRSFQLDTHQSFMPYISRMQEDIQMCNHFSIDEKSLNQIGKLFLQMCNGNEMFIPKGVFVWPNTNDFTSRKHTPK